MTLHGIDISHHQGSIDFARARADGMTFSVARATIATKPDADYPAFTRGAEAAGMIAGAYHFLYPARVVAPEAQCDAFLEAVGETAGRLLMLDVEVDRYPTPDAVPTGEDMRRWVARFRERVPTHPLLIYAPRWYWRGHIGNPPAAQYGPLWASHYVTPSTTPPDPWRDLWAKVPASWWAADHGGWTRATILQFTSSGEVRGYSGRLDVNAFQGTRDELLRLTVDREVEAMRLKNVIPVTATVKLTKPWPLWRVSDDEQTKPVPAGTVFAAAARCQYHSEDFPGYIVPYGPDKTAHVLPAGAEVGLEVTVTPVDPAILVGIQRAEYDRVKAGTTAAATLPPRP